MFVLSKSALTSRPLLVNPSLVRAVVDGDQMGQGKICFDDQQSYGSRYGDGNSTKIDGRIGADHAAPRIGPTEISGAVAISHIVAEPRTALANWRHRPNQCTGPDGVKFTSCLTAPITRRQTATPAASRPPRVPQPVSRFLPRQGRPSA